MYLCLECNKEFNESEAKIIEFGTGHVLSKVELLGCPECESIKIEDLETGKIQN